MSQENWWGTNDWGIAGPPKPQRAPGLVGVQDIYDPYFTNDNPQALWSNFLDKAGINRDSAFGRYAAAQMAPHFARYLLDSQKDPTLQWSQYPNQDVANQIKQGFQLLSPDARGENPGMFWGNWAGKLG